MTVADPQPKLQCALLQCLRDRFTEVEFKTDGSPLIDPDDYGIFWEADDDTAIRDFMAAFISDWKEHTMTDKTVAELMALADARELARKRQYECEHYINTYEDTAGDRAELAHLKLIAIDADHALEAAIRRAVAFEQVAWMRTYSDGLRTLRWETMASHPDAQDTPLYARNKP